MSSRTALFRAGLHQIYRDHPTAILNPKTSYHFVRPSGRHTGHFLRAAETLRYGAQISFIAASILPHLSLDEISCIYTDTSAINSVAYALLEIWSALVPSLDRPTVDSFGSYEGIRGGCDFEPREGCLCLISAATSSKMVDEIEQERLVPRAHQVILFYVGPSLGDTTNILCDLTKRDDNPSGTVEIFEDWDPQDCRLCPAESDDCSHHR
ncbi:MAG TPA: hypothetical protein VF612_15610 [Jatrophihabitans sp.]|jgi:hypothetical protein|uniref:hypothetical protein n=1 Tax=Jatrophihabitans sp. TaxID=1932789 RepID=UPI002F1B35DE